MTQWYYANTKNERQGPVESGTIRDKLGRGELNQDTLVWRDGMAQWQPLSSVQAELVADTPAPASDEPARAESSATASPYAAPSSTLSVGDGIVASVGDEIVYAGFWKRAAANIIDGLLVNAVSFFLMMMIGPIFGLSALTMLGIPEGGWANPNMATVGFTAAEAILQLVLMALTAAYFAWFHSSRNMATLGKMAVGIKVVRADGSPITLARGIGRYFALMLSSFTLGIGLLMAAFTGRKQALHDMICDTLVVDKWAFTERPDLQQKGLGPVTIIVLVLFGLLLAFIILMAIIAAGVLISQVGGGSWR